MAVSSMRHASGRNYRNSSFIVDVAMGQIPRSTERISSFWRRSVYVWVFSSHIPYINLIIQRDNELCKLNGQKLRVYGDPQHIGPWWTNQQRYSHTEALTSFQWVPSVKAGMRSHFCGTPTPSSVIFRFRFHHCTVATILQAQRKIWGFAVWRLRNLNVCMLQLSETIIQCGVVALLFVHL